MSEFWRGFLALPAIALGIAVVVIAVCGAWVLAEKWADHRTREMNYRDDEPPGQTQYRSHPAAVFLAAPKARWIKLGFGAGLLYTRGINRVPKDQFRKTLNAVIDATHVIDRQTEE